MMPRTSLVFTGLLGLLIVLSSCAIGEAAGGSAVGGKKESAKPQQRQQQQRQRKNSARRPARKRYNEVTELMSDMGRDICHSLGKLVKRKNFDYRRRCDLYAEVIEDLGGMTDAMVKEMDQMQQDMVDTAMKFPHYANLQMNLKKVAKMVLERRQPSEKQIQEELTKDMSQWILNVATQQEGSSSGLDKLPRESLKNLRNMGINLPATSGLDVDDTDEEDFLLSEADRSWAGSNDISGDDDDDDEDDDDDDDA